MQSYFFTNTKRCFHERGFTLIETLVAVGLFTIVTTIASSAFLAMINADRTSRQLRIATDNLNLTIEDMSRRIKTGTRYGCDPVSNPGSVNGTNDCVNGRESIAFTDQNGVRTMYKLGLGTSDSNTGGCGDPLYELTRRCILRFSDGAWTPVTSYEINITKLRFFVRGSSSADVVQPYVIILVDGELGVPPKPVTKFKVQTMVTQRQLDI